MRDRTFLETTDALREAACCVAGHFPHIPYQIYPSVRVERARLGLPPATPEDDRDDDMAPDPVRVACGRIRRRAYELGERCGQLTVLSRRPTAYGKGFFYTCECAKCGSSREYTGTRLYLAQTRDQGCGCRNQAKVAA